MAQKFLSAGASYQVVSDALGYTLLHLGPDDNDFLRRICLEATYAEIAKILGRDASAKEVTGRYSNALKEIKPE